MEFLLDFSVLVGILGILDYNSRRIARRFVRRGAETRPSFPKERKFDIGLEWIVYIYIYMYDYRGGKKRGGGNQETIFRSNFHGMGLSIVVSSGRSFSRFIFPPRETRIVALFQWEWSIGEHHQSGNHGERRWLLQTNRTSKVHPI